jgi:hypothetical protein
LTLAFAKAQARKMRDAPSEDTIAGLRNRAILSLGSQVGFRRAQGRGLASKPRVRFAIDEPLFRPLKNNDKRQEERRGMAPDAIVSRAPEIRRRYPWASTLLECHS